MLKTNSRPADSLFCWPKKDFWRTNPYIQKNQRAENLLPVDNQRNISFYIHPFRTTQRYTTGIMNMFSNVDERRPPSTTTAMGL